jgi:hypothetical protein
MHGKADGNLEQRRAELLRDASYQARLCRALAAYCKCCPIRPARRIHFARSTIMLNCSAMVR